MEKNELAKNRCPMGRTENCLEGEVRRIYYGRWILALRPGSVRRMRKPFREYRWSAVEMAVGHTGPGPKDISFRRVEQT